MGFPFLIYLLLCQFSSSVSYGELNIYTHRHYESDKVLFKNFTNQTGVKINVIKGSADQLIQRLKSEGNDSPADILISVDAGRLVRAKKLGLLQPVFSADLLQNVPKSMRDSENYWFGLSIRARVIVYAKDRVKEEELSTYEDLADPKWKGRLVIRSSNNIYNQSLLASIIEHNGKQKATKWARSVRKNMARRPRGNDRDQARAVANGVADLALINTYYLGLLANSQKKEDREVASKLKVFFPNQDNRGAHINVSGAGLTASSKNKQEAVMFLEFLTKHENQKLFAESNFEYPLEYQSADSEILMEWGKFKADKLNLSILGRNNLEAVKVFDIVGWE